MGIVQFFKNMFGPFDTRPQVGLLNSEEVTAQGTVIVPYPLNDPTTPNLMLETELPNHPSKLDFWVKGYARGKVRPNTPQHRAANCYVTVGNCINYMQRVVGQYDRPIPRWAAVQKLAVVPDNGKMLNAYYDRRHLMFFHDADVKTGKMVYTADSTDIVAHELGHAILDAMRPDFWSVQALEIWSFHESFADITAILSIMQYEPVLKRALKETSGDLSKSNVISRLAEEMGNTIYNLTKGRSGHQKGSLRDAVNDYRYIDPRRLPKNAPANKLAAECHSFGRIFLAAWYDIMVAIYNMELETMSPLDALKHARDTAAYYLLKSVPRTPRTAEYTEAAAKAMLSVDREKGSPYHRLMKKVFTTRRIIKPRIKTLSNKTWLDLRKELEVDDIVTKNGGDVTSVRLSRTQNLKLSEHIKDVSSLSVGDVNLMDVEMDVPVDHYYEFGRNGALIEEIRPDMQQIVDDVYACALAIQQNGQIGDGGMWAVDNGKLVRNRVE